MHTKFETTPYSVNNTRISNCLKLVSLLICGASSNLAIATETYYALFIAPNQVMHDTRFELQLKYDIAQDKTIQGTLKDYNQSKCVISGGRTVSGKIEGNTISFVTNVPDLQGCGAYIFNGVREGDDWVGTINYRGNREITFKKD